MKMTVKAKASYGFCAVGKDLVYALSASYVLYYYNVVMGVSATFIGAILMVARIFDAVNDPLMGVVVAKTNTRFGRFRPWLFSGTILNAFVLFALFTVPGGMEGKGLLIYFAVIYILWTITYTIMDIPYWSMIPAIADTPKERENLSVIGRSCAGVGGAIIAIATMIMVSRLGGGSTPDAYRTGFKWFSLIISVFFVISMLVAVINIKEGRVENFKTVSIGQMFRSLFNNDQAIIVVITIIFVNTALYITSNLILYFFQFDIGGTKWEGTYALFNTFGGGTQLISMMVLYPLIRKKLETVQVFKLALSMAILGYLLILLLVFTGMTRIYFLFIPGFFIFAGNGMLTVLTTVFLADTVDYGELKNGHREESVIFSMQTFVVKLSSGLAVMIASVGLDLINLDVTAALQTDSAILGLRLIMSVLPIIGLVATMIFFRRYKLNAAEIKRISEQLDSRTRV